MSLYGEREGAVRPVLQIAMSRLPRVHARGGEAYGRPSNEGCPALRFWTMLAHRQGAPLNVAELARSLPLRAERSFHAVCEDLSPARRFVEYPGPERFPLPADMEAMPLLGLSMLASSRGGNRMNIFDLNPKVHPSSFSSGRNVGRFQVFPGGPLRRSFGSFQVQSLSVVLFGLFPLPAGIMDHSHADQGPDPDSIVVRGRILEGLVEIFSRFFKVSLVEGNLSQGLIVARP